MVWSRALDLWYRSCWWEGWARGRREHRVNKKDGGGVVFSSPVNVHSHAMSSCGILVVGTDLFVVSRV